MSLAIIVLALSVLTLALILASVFQIGKQMQRELRETRSDLRAAQHELDLYKVNVVHPDFELIRKLSEPVSLYWLLRAVLADGYKDGDLI